MTVDYTHTHAAHPNLPPLLLVVACWLLIVVPLLLAMSVSHCCCCFRNCSWTPIDTTLPTHHSCPFHTTAPAFTATAHHTWLCLLLHIPLAFL